MTKHTWSEEIARPPSESELRELDRALGEWREENPDAMPPELWLKLRQLIDWRLLQRQPSRTQKQRMRWEAVHAGFKLHPKKRERACAHAVKLLHGTPYQASSESTMWKAFRAVEDRLARRRGISTPDIPDKTFGAKRRPR
jgi:hypothetical protein